jgi:hypothetical protein
MPVDAARRQLGLLSVADSQGQARIAWLVDLGSGVIEDARFLAFGSLESHPIADAFTEMVRGRTVADAAKLTPEQIEIMLRDQPSVPAFGEHGLQPLAFIHELQERAVAAVPSLTLLPKPVDVPSYERKRKQDWNEADQRWLPLGLMQKTVRVEEVIKEAMRTRVERDGLSWRLDAINDDFRIVLRFFGVSEEQVPTLAKFIEDALRGQVHPQLVVEATS